jgi:hypothetical protein
MLALTRAGEFYPALVLFKPRLKKGRLEAAGYICNRPLNPGGRLRVLERTDGGWRVQKGSAAYQSPALPLTADTFATPIELEAFDV